MLGNFHIKVSVSSMPQKVASFDATAKGLTGAKYDIFAYLGSQVVNGTNHAVLATQTLSEGVDTKNVVLMILNEKNNTVSIEEIRKVLDTGAGLGAVTIAPTANIPEEAKKLFEEKYTKLFGITNEIFAMVGSQVVDGAAYIYAVKTKSIGNPLGDANLISAGNSATIKLVKLFTNYDIIESVDILSGTEMLLGSSEAPKLPLGYAFSWYKGY